MQNPMRREKVTNPLVNGKTFKTAHHNLHGVHQSIKTENPCRKVFQKMNSKIYPRYGKDQYKIPGEWD